MITIPTCELVGILADVIPLAHPEPEEVGQHAVLLDWDGHQLRASATDSIRMGISTWDPDDPPDEDAQDSLFTQWGSDDEPWTAHVDLDDAKHLVKMFKLGPKQGQIPLVVEHDVTEGDPGRVRVFRSRDTGLSALTAVVESGDGLFPNLAKLLATKTVEPVDTLAFNAKYLADFAKVRPRGPMEMRFVGPNRLVQIRIGKRFAGAIMPVRLAEEEGSGNG